MCVCVICAAQKDQIIEMIVLCINQRLVSRREEVLMTVGILSCQKRLTSYTILPNIYEYNLETNSLF